MDSEIQPQGIPQEILKNKKAIDLYKWSLWIIGAIVGGISGNFVQSVKLKGAYKMKIYVLMCSDTDEYNDIPWKYFVSEELANYWRDEYNKQARAEFEEDCDDEEMSVHYYVEEQEIEQTKNVDNLYGNTDVEPVQIDVIFGKSVIDELFKSRGLC